MVMAVRRAGGAFLQLIDGLLDGVESVNDQVIAQPMPGWILAALNTDIDQHERLAQNARLRDPGGKFGIGIGEQIQTLLPFLRGFPWPQADFQF